MVQVEIQNDKTSLDNMPKILLRAQRQQHPPSITKEDMRLDRTFAPGTSKTLVPRAKHIIGYKGFQRGNKCKEDLGNLERTAELETLLRELSKGVNGVTLAGYDILRTTPSTSMQQELHCKKVASPILVAGTRQFKRLQSAETAYADAYAKMNQGTGPFASKDKGGGDH